MKKRVVPWWVWASVLLPIGFGAWAPLIPGLALRRKAWIAWGALWTAIAVFGFVASTIVKPDWPGGVLMLGWVGGAVTTLAIRPAYQRELDDPFRREKETAERRLRDRREAERIARERPELARELHLERVGLVDVNHAPAAALRKLPGVDAALAARIISLRQRINGFESLEDLGMVLDLDGDAVERLRDRTVFLPR
jgi:Helix-hairpin-helix motif